MTEMASEGLSARKGGTAEKAPARGSDPFTARLRSAAAARVAATSLRSVSREIGKLPERGSIDRTFVERRRWKRAGNRACSLGASGSFSLMTETSAVHGLHNGPQPGDG